MEGRKFKKRFWTFKTPWLLKPEFQEVDRGKRGIPFRKKKTGRKKHRIYSGKIEK